MVKKFVIIFLILFAFAGVTIGLLRRKELAKSPAPFAMQAPLASTPLAPVTTQPSAPIEATSSAEKTPPMAPQPVKSASTKTTTAAPASYAHEIKVGPQILYVDISTTPAQMQQGLSDRLSMEQDQGMLFNFGLPQMPEFWMNDMNFSLDFLWVNSGKIIGITPDAPAAPKNPDGSFNDTNLPLYPPPSPVDEVIEVNTGWAQKNSIAVGDAVQIIN